MFDYYNPQGTSGLVKQQQHQQERRQEPQRELFRPTSLVIIREIYDSENAYEYFEQQLERALANEAEVIVIEPFKLGDETARWISVGNCLHKTSVLAGFGSLVAAFVWPDKKLISLPAAVLTVVCVGLYSISWQFDPCCKYQVESDSRQLAQLSLQPLNSSSPVVLVRRDDTRRKILHTAVAIACITQTGLRLYYPYISQLFGRAVRRVFNTESDFSSTTVAGKLVVTDLPHPAVNQVIYQ
jgi:hypothetical protein